MIQPVGVFITLLFQTKAKCICSVFSSELDTSPAKRAHGIEILEDLNQPHNPATEPNRGTNHGTQQKTQA